MLSKAGLGFSKVSTCLVASRGEKTTAVFWVDNGYGRDCIVLYDTTFSFFVRIGRDLTKARSGLILGLVADWTVVRLQGMKTIGFQTVKDFCVCARNPRSRPLSASSKAGSLHCPCSLIYDIGHVHHQTSRLRNIAQAKVTHEIVAISKPYTTPALLTANLNRSSGMYGDTDLKEI